MQVLRVLNTSQKMGPSFGMFQDLASVLEYAQWRNFYKKQKKQKLLVITGYDIDDHFAEVSKMVIL